MKIVTIDKALLEKYSSDTEMLQKSGRPCVLVIRLKYIRKEPEFRGSLQAEYTWFSTRKSIFCLASQVYRKANKLF